MAGTTSDRDSVLIPAKRNPACYTCVRSLAKHGVRTIVASERDDVPAGGSRFCDEQLKICPPEDDLIAYKDALKGIAARPSVRTILPLRPVDPYVLATYREEFERYVSLPIPPIETLSIVNDRKKLYDAAVEANVPAPKTWCFDDVDEWNDSLVIKSRYNLLTADQAPLLAPGTCGIEKEIIYVESGDDPHQDGIVSEMKHSPIVQEYIPKEAQYVFGALYDRGEAVATFQHRQIRANSYTGGGGVYRESMYDSDLEVVGRRLLDSLDWHGLACIEYAKDRNTGEYKLLEINPRFWQSLPCAVRAGADFPKYYWLQATGRPAPTNPRYDSHVRSHFLYGEVRHLLSLWRDEPVLVGRPSGFATTRDILTSCVTTPHFDVFRLDDPVPFLREVRRILRNKMG